MASRRRGAHTPLRTAKQDIAALRKAPQTPQTASAAYRLAYTDEEFITADDTRGIRFQPEYMKPSCACASAASTRPSCCSAARASPRAGQACLGRPQLAAWRGSIPWPTQQNASYARAQRLRAGSPSP